LLGFVQCQSTSLSSSQKKALLSDISVPELVWSEEFNYNGLPDTTIWGYNIGGHGWGNNELQYYKSADSASAYVSNGTLKITARKEEAGERSYTSARLNSSKKMEFRYGDIQIRAKLPEGRGLWPAIWMLGSNISEARWPSCGEIDILEHVGYDPGQIHGTVHTGAYNHIKGTHKGKAHPITNPYSEFHIFSIKWSPEKIVFLLDGEDFFEFENEYLTTEEWPFDQPFYLILNLAVGGNWGGRQGVDDTVFPAEFEIDYIRVYKFR